MAETDGVERCPTGCELDELEIGTEHESAHALFGLPFKHVKCGECGFNEDNKTGLANNRDGAIAHWNAAVLAEREKSNG